MDEVDTQLISETKQIVAPQIGVATLPKIVEIVVVKI
jgi:hypothetical protein